MAKKDQAQVDALIEKVRLLGALRWTEEVLPDVAPPDRWDGYTQGWRYFGVAGGFTPPSVEEAWSGATRHGSGKAPAADDEYRSAQQNAVRLYSTRLLALKAMRHALELKAAEVLARVDAMIEAEMSKPDPPKDGEAEEPEGYAMSLLMGRGFTRQQSETAMEVVGGLCRQCLDAPADCTCWRDE